VIWITLLLAAIAAIWDLRTREVPDWISIVILATAVLATACGWSSVKWGGLLSGLAIGFVLSAMVFYVGGLGGADVKLTAALGAVTGPLAILGVLFWTAIAGAVLALVAWSRGQRDFAYVPAIAAGLAIYAIWPEGLRYVLLP
jgi:prepilin peptidase CpaA